MNRTSTADPVQHIHVQSNESQKDVEDEGEAHTHLHSYVVHKGMYVCTLYMPHACMYLCAYKSKMGEGITDIISMHAAR